MNDISKLSLLRGSEYEIINGINIKHPKLSDIEDIGEDKYNKNVSCLCSTSLDIADILWFDLGIWFEDIKDEWEFFIQKCLMEHKEISVKIKYNSSDIPVLETNCLAINDSYRDAINYFFGLSGEYIVLEKNINGVKQKIFYNVVPYCKDDKVLYYIFDEDSFKFTKFFYEITVNFLSNINWIKKNYDFLNGGSKGAKKYILKKTMYEKRGKNQKEIITLESITSSLIAKGVCSLKEIWSYPIYTVYDVYYRLVKMCEYSNTMTALYSGCIDTKKNPINWEKINWSAVID